jgi:hypothetical protein
MRSGPSSIRDWTSETVLPMSRVSETKVTTAAGIALAAMLGMIVVAANGQMNTVVKDQTVADANGNLHVPDAYRSTYQALGSWAVEAEQGRGLKELHVVYASPGTIEAYRKDRRFPEGTVLVKDVFQTASGQMTTGTVSHADSLKGRFVMVKDSNGRYPGNKLWGNGWGWSWFDADNFSANTAWSRISTRNCSGERGLLG